jgi:signal transduction histidine kinase
MGLSDWLRPPRYLLALFAVVTLVPAAALVWLGWQFIGQDRAVEKQESTERLGSAADRVAANLTRSLAATARDFPSWLSNPPAEVATGAAVLRLGPNGAEDRAGVALPFVPLGGIRTSPPRNLPAWDAAISMEFRQHDFAAAATAFRELAASSAPDLRAAALLAMARNLRALGRREDALEVYRSLQKMGDVWIDALDEPADLVGRAAECVLLAELGSREELTRIAQGLAHDLARGRWKIDRGTYEMRIAEVAPWATAPADAEAATLATAVDAFWNEWRARPDAALAPGRKSVSADGRDVLLIWTSSGDSVVLFAAGASYVNEILRQAKNGESERVQVSLSGAAGTPARGNPGARDEEPFVLRGTDTNLPWTLHVSDAAAADRSAAFGARRQLVGWSLAILVVLIPVGGYVVWRAVQRELAVAQLQADFVSAVSHEFRTPLTSMAHLTERLQRDAAIPDERKRQYYDVLARDTDRLRRFVETLLDFGKMEAGAAPVRPEPVNLTAVVAEIVNEFRQEPAAERRNIRVQDDGLLPPVPLDREAFGRALWNLLDNATKYSPAGAPITVGVRRDARAACVDVVDQGVGIPPSEHRQIFHKFVRGAGSSTSGIKGTGVGLAMVDHIIRAHGGHVRVASVVGQGSTFSLVLPFEGTHPS